MLAVQFEVPLVKYLQNWVGLEQAVSEGRRVIVSGAGDGVVEEDLLGCFCFTCSTLT